MKKTEEEKNSKFFKIWSAKRKVGRNKHVLKWSIIYAVVLLISQIGINLYTGDDFNFVVFIALSIGGVIGSILSWYANEKTFSEILEKQSQEEPTTK